MSMIPRRLPQYQQNSSSLSSRTETIVNGFTTTIYTQSSLTTVSNSTLDYTFNFVVTPVQPQILSDTIDSSVPSFENSVTPNRVIISRKLQINITSFNSKKTLGFWNQTLVSVLIYFRLKIRSWFQFLCVLYWNRNWFQFILHLILHRILFSVFIYLIKIRSWFQVLYFIKIRTWFQFVYLFQNRTLISFYKFLYTFIYLFRSRASHYNNNGKLDDWKRLKQQDLEGRERLY